MKKSTKTTNKKSVNSTAMIVAANTATTVAPVAGIAPFQSVSMRLPLSQIDPSPFNPRKDFKPGELDELTVSIRNQGVLSDILVRPKAEGRYEIVFGERRFRAAQLAELENIPAKVREMSDEEAEDCAITENLLREDLSPFEEAQLFRHLEETRGMDVKEICSRYGKSETFVRGRINLNKLIPEVAQMLENEEIGVEMASEFANYEDTIQKEVYDQHFRNEGYFSWKGIKVGEFKKRLYDKYMTKLDSYSFDKTECATCGHNTFNQVLFTDCGDCAGCQNHACMQDKNRKYLVDRCIELSAQDPRLHLAVFPEFGDTAVIDQLTDKGHEVETLDGPYYLYKPGPSMPDAPIAEDYDDPDDYQMDKEEYDEEMESFKEECTGLEFDISEGRIRKYAVIRNTEIDIRYETVREETVTENGVTRTLEPESPAKDLIRKDSRNKEICYEHITKDLKKVLRCSPEVFPKSELTSREEQIMYYVMLDRISYSNKQILGIESSYNDSGDRLKAAENLTPEQKTMLARMAIMRYMDDLNEYNCKEDSIDIKLMTEFAELHFPEQSKAILDRHKNIFDKRHTNLQVRIDALEQEAERLRLEAKGLVKVGDDLVSIETGEIVEAGTPAIITAENQPDAETPEEPAVEAAPAEETLVEEPEPADYPEPAEMEEPREDYIPYEEELPDMRELIPADFYDPDLKTLGKKKRTTKAKTVKTAA